MTILSHPDSGRVGERALLWDEETADGEAFLGRWRLDFAPPGGGPARPLDDPYLSRRPVRFAAARFGGIRIDCTDSGTRVVANDDWIAEDRVFLGVEVERGVILVLSERVVLLLHNVEPRLDHTVPGFGLVGSSPRMMQVRHQIRELSEHDLPVLVRGATGTGKKAVARAIHAASRGEELPCVTLSMAQSPSLHEVSEHLSQAARGSLVVEAVESLGTEMQRELLRLVRQDAHGVRLLAVTSTDSAGKAGDAGGGPLVDELREQTIELPALTKRREDFGRLLFHFLRQELERLDALHCLRDPGPYASPWLPVRLTAQLAAYDWPRNVRQLERVTRQIAIDHHQKAQVEAPADLEALLEGRSDSWSWPEEGGESQRSPSEISEIELLSALRAHRWQAEPTAAHLGVTPEILFELIERFSEKSQKRKPRPRSDGAR